MRLNTVRSFLSICLTLASTMNASAQSLPQCSDQGTWSEESFLPSGGIVEISSPLLLTDGRVLAQYISGLSGGNAWQDWYALTPSKSGCYSVNTVDCVGGLTASWSRLASLTSLPVSYGPSGFASAVLPDGKVIIEGGEDNFLSRVEINFGALYDPVANTWTNVDPPPTWPNFIGDAPSVVLANGTYMLGNACGINTGTGLTALFDESTLTRTDTTEQPPEWTAEASFTLLPDNSVLSVGTCFPGEKATNTCTTLNKPNNSQIYDPATGGWGSLGNTPQRLYAFGTGLDERNSCFADGPIFGEQGPAALLPTGDYFATGGYVQSAAAVHTSGYNTATKKWFKTPNLPLVTVGASTYSLSAEDQGSVVLTDGNYLIYTRPRNNAEYIGEAFLIEWNGTSYCQLTDVPSGIPGQVEMMTLPTGQVLMTSVSWWVNPWNYFIYTPGGTTYPGIEPEIGTSPTVIDRGATYTVTGYQFNGATQASFFGDDFQNATNYPLVRVTNNVSGHVFYAKTHNPSTMAVATGATPVSTFFDVPANAELGDGSLVVVANGIPSKPVPVTVQQ